MYLDPVAVWCCPCQLPTDIVFWEAVAPPLDMPLPRNSVFVAACGLCTTHLAGGDSDCDAIMCSVDSELIRFLKYTKEFVKPFHPGQATYEDINRGAERYCCCI